MKWKNIPIEDVFTCIKNGASIKQDEGLSGVPITRIETISDGYLNTSKLGYANIAKNEYLDYYLKGGDILMSHINSWKHLGKTALIDSDKEIIHGMNLLLMRPDKKVLLPSYANYYFSTDSFKAQLHKISNQSVNQSSFAVTKFKKLFIPLPPLHIQEQIAETLDKADALRRKDQELLTKYDELAQAIFYDMFGDPVKNERGWDTKEIRKVCDFAQGIQIPIEEQKYIKKEGYKRFLRISDFTSNVEDRYVLCGDKKAMVKKDDIVIVRYGASAGHTGTGVEGILANNLFNLNYNRSVLVNRYFYYFLNTTYFKSFINKVAFGAAMPALSFKVFENFIVQLPPIYLQQLFSERVLIIEKQKIAVSNDLSTSFFNNTLERFFS
jgi:type I restriction enzyme S subunit